ncbi:MAG TPA: CpsB/CapC family capsule biosynthesis tyrosine phosphatase [Arenimonas sp.]|nr:CpsB/CapC family capsule biosynthesis tyrosine phosphatase [Arenimonas sp.]
MIDLHCHMLPGIDDGAPDLEVSLAMARCAVEDGITLTACTPHIYPGLYENDKPGIEAAITALRRALAEAGIPLQLTIGADTHLAPDLVASIRGGRVPTLAGSRYLLFEPPHHVAPPRFEESVFNLMAAGYVPVITHPERLSWIETHYAVFGRLVHAGAWIQVTAGAVTGRFGRRPKYWAERLLDEGLVHILATDSHHIDKRPPLLAEGRDAAASRLGAFEAEHLVLTRPRGIVDDVAPGLLPALPAVAVEPEKRPGLWQRLFGGP